MITKDLFFSLNNPVIFSFIIFITIAVLLYLFLIRIYKPLQQKHALEKEILQLRNTRLMAMFAELDPEPLFRFDTNGKIIFTNESGSRILDKFGSSDVYLTEIFAIGPVEFEKFISNGDSLQTTQKIGEEYFDVNVKGIPEAGFGQIYCNDITARKESQEDLKKSQDRLRQLSVYLQKVQENEKQNISRELHDNFGQILTTIKMNLELIKDKYRDRELREQFKDIEAQLEEARREIRELSYRLRPRVLDDFGLAPALKTMCEDASKRTGISGSFQSYNYTQRLQPEIETHVYRIVQEALNNIVKHSKAKEFSVQLVKHSDKIIISIEDDGIGFENNGEKRASGKSGMGMLNINERALTFNGMVTINSRPGSGTEIIIEIPIEKEYEKDQNSDCR
jgi:signal transduction histidine kinase